MKYPAVILATYLLAATGGCTHRAPAPDVSVTYARGNDRVISMSQGMQAPVDPDAPRDAPPAETCIFQVDVYQLAVPYGTFSGNEPFWKRIDEQCVDQATHDVLWRNGLRIGEAPRAELEFFRKFMDVKPVMDKLSTSAPEAQKIELEMKKDLPEQRIWRLDRDGKSAGRDYDRCSDVINMSFQPAPRKPECLRLSLCPMVRSNRKHLEYTELNNEAEIQFVQREMLYDLNLCVDIPRDRFFIVTPSPEAAAASSVGSAFMTKDGHTDRLEQIILIIPNVVTFTAGK